MTKLSLHVGDKGHPFAPQVLAPNSQLEPNGTIFGPTVARIEAELKVKA